MASATVYAVDAPTYDLGDLGLPPIGEWMLDRNLQPAKWFGEKLDGKELWEPINLVIIDAVATSAAEATERVIAAAAQAGYRERIGHSTGYSGLIGDQIFGQIGRKVGHAFSDGWFFVDNNHGRIFGPLAVDDAFLFIAAFSREHFTLFPKISHDYVSFAVARDDLAARMDEKTPFKRVAKVNLNNVWIDDPERTTGDHDGYAWVLKASPVP